MSAKAPVKRLPSPQSTSSCWPHVTASVAPLSWAGRTLTTTLMLDSSAGSSIVSLGSLMGSLDEQPLLELPVVVFSEKRLRRQEEVSAGPSYGCGLKRKGPNRAKKQRAGCLTAAVQKRAIQSGAVPGCPRSSLRALLDAVDEREPAERIDRAKTG